MISITEQNKNFKVHYFALKVYLLQDIPKDYALESISYFIDSTLLKDNFFNTFHNSHQMKFYNFSSFEPFENDYVFKAGKLYSISIRVVDERLATYLKNHLADHSTNNMKGLVLEERIIYQRYIEKLNTLTPVMMRFEGKGYWRFNDISLQEIEKQIKINIKNKYAALTGIHLPETTPFYDSISFHREKPYTIFYKGRKMFGDKFELYIASDEESQRLAYLALGCGLGLMNARGYGYSMATFL